MTFYAEGDAPWSEDEQFAEAAKACKARCRKFGTSCDDMNFEGECDECTIDALMALDRKYSSKGSPK